MTCIILHTKVNISKTHNKLNTKYNFLQYKAKGNVTLAVQHSAFLLLSAHSNTPINLLYKVFIQNKIKMNFTLMQDIQNIYYWHNNTNYRVKTRLCISQ